MKNKALIAIIIGGLSACAQASIVTLSMSGTGSGSLDGVGFTDKTFTWDISYDSESINSKWGSAQPIFTNLFSSVISLQDETDPINITQDHGVWVYDTTALWFAPIKMSGTSTGGNILTVYDSSMPGWDGTSDYSQAGGIDADFGQFYYITTDQGTLELSSGTLDSVNAAIPEPATIGLIGLFGGGIFAIRRLFMI